MKQLHLIKKKINYKFLHLFGVLIVAIISFACAVNQSKVKKKKFNVLFIAIDDLRPELGAYGASHIISPNIDKLAEEGILFRRAYVQQAICMASRASILTGLRPETNKIYTGESVKKLVPNTTTLNELFEENGYNVAGTGKIYHHNIDNKTQFQENYIESKKTWKARGYVLKESLEQKKLNTKHNRGPAYEFADVHDTIYKDGINTLNAIRKMKEFKKKQKPFFLAVGLSKPHLPFVAPKKYWDMYDPAKIGFTDLKKRPKDSYSDAIRKSGELTNYYNIPRLYEDIADSTALNLRRAYYSCITYADAQVGKLLSTLKNLNLDKNIIVVLWGDHGYKLGDYNSWCKWSNMDIDTNIPLIFSHPDGLKGKESSEIVEALSIYPTLADLCGIEIPQHVEGKSLKPILENPTITSKDKYAFSIWPIDRRKYDKTIMGYSVKTKYFNYVEWIKLSTGEVIEKELFDRKDDAKETVNVVAQEKYKPTVAKLSEKLKERIRNTN